MEEKFGFIYLWFDKKHKRYYVGSHWGTEDDGYICSSTWMRNSKNNRPKDFKRKIIEKIYTNRKDLLLIEYKWLSKIKKEELGKKYYNLTNHLNGHWFTDEHKKMKLKQRISEKTKEAMQRDDVRENYLNGLKTRNSRSSDPEVREKRRQSMIKTMATKFPDRKVRLKFGSDEYRENMASKTREFWKDSNHRKTIGEKISKGLIGKKIRLGQTNSKEHRAKIKEGLKIHWENRTKVDKTTPEYRANLKAIAKRYRDKKRAERIGVYTY